MSRRITMAEVARKAGVHQSTVSLALRNDPRLPTETRERLQALARELGYRPNPMVSALISERRRRGASEYGSGLAFLTSCQGKGEWRISPTYVRLFERMSIHAHDLGYRLEEFWLDEPGMTPGRLRSILLHRGIRGIVICPLQGLDDQLNFDFSEFAAVALGYTLRRPALDHVSTDYAANMGLAIERLLALGYQRIRFVSTSKVDRRVNHFSLGRYLVERYRHRERLLEPLVLDLTEPSPMEMILRDRPDAILVPTGAEFGFVEEGLERLKIAVPEEVALVTLDRRKAHAESGVDRLLDDEAHAAIAFVTSRVERARFGLPRAPQSILLAGRWESGWSTLSR